MLPPSVIINSHTRNPDHVVSVKTRGLSSADREVLIATAIGAAIIYPLVAFAVVDTTPATVVPRLLIGTVVIAVTSLSMANIQAIRRVDIDDSGVTFRYLLRKVHASWSDLLPPGPNRYASQYGGIFMRRVVPKTGGATRRGHFVTRDQARAVLNHPNCPRWNLDANLRAFLGLES